MSSGRIRASTSRLSSDGTISTSGAPGATAAAEGGDEHPVDPAGSGARTHGPLEPARPAPAGRARRAESSAWAAASSLAASARQSWRCWASADRASATPARAREMAAAAAAASLAATAAALSAWTRDSRGSMPRSTSGRRIRDLGRGALARGDPRLIGRPRPPRRRAGLGDPRLGGGDQAARARPCARRGATARSGSGRRPPGWRRPDRPGSRPATSAWSRAIFTRAR